LILPSKLPETDPLTAEGLAPEVVLEPEPKSQTDPADGVRLGQTGQHRHTHPITAYIFG